MAGEETENRQAADLGTLVHAALAHYWRGEEDLPVCLARAARETALAQYTDAAREILETFLASDACARLRAMQVLDAEIPFSRQTPQGVVSGVMDLLLRDTDGTVWVVDFKTDRTDDPAQLAEKYRPQLQAYVQAARQMYPQNTVRGAAVLVRAGRLAELA